ncbi:F-box protein At2g17036 [Linum perenne]
MNPNFSRSISDLHPAKTSAMSHWPKNLPSELLERIASLIDTETDLIRFGFVCSSWNNSAAVHRERFYAAALQYLPGDDLRLSSELELIKHTISLVGDRDLGSWLVKVAEREDIRNYKRLLNPLQSYPFRSDSFTENIPRVFPMQRLGKAVVVWSPAGSGEFVVVLTIVRGRMTRFDTGKFGKKAEDELVELNGGSHGLRGEKKFLVEEKAWVEVQSLGDDVLFLGDESPFSVSSSDLRVRKNCIFFNETSSWSCPKKDMDAFYFMSVFYLQCRNSTPLKNCGNYSKLLWPPPAWLSPPMSSCDNID